MLHKDDDCGALGEQVTWLDDSKSARSDAGISEFVSPLRRLLDRQAANFSH